MKTNKKSKSKKQVEILTSLSYGDCHCEWLGSENSEVQLCGGCQSEVRLYRNSSIHWRGTHWHLKCAFEQSQIELAENKTLIAELKTKLSLGTTEKNERREFAEAATKFYFEHLEKILEPERIGEFVSIDPESGQYFLGETLGEAISKGRQAFPDKILFSIKIGYDAVFKFGGILRPRNSPPQRQTLKRV